MPETGTFLSRDPVESEPAYQYVRGNPVNLSDPSGKFPPFPNPPVGQGSVVPPGVCDTWRTDRDLCLRAAEYGLGSSNGDALDAMEQIFAFIVLIDWNFGRFEGARALGHYLEGTTTPGEPMYFSSYWYLQAPETTAARDALKERIVTYIDNLRDNCQCTPVPIRIRTVYHPTQYGINIDPHVIHPWVTGPIDIPGLGQVNIPEQVGIPDDRQIVLVHHPDLKFGFLPWE